MANTLVFIGDSLTEWFDWQRRFPDYTVVNLGIAGETIEGLLARRARIRSMVQDPGHIFLMTGINNIAMGQYDIRVQYGEIVRNLTTWYKKADVVVQSILPVDMPGLDNSIIAETNRQLAELAQQYQTHFLDVHRLFLDRNNRPVNLYLNDDGVHLSSKGYEVWADEVERFLKQ